MSEARLRELLAEYAADEPPMRLRPEQVMHVRVRSPWRVTLAAAVSAALLVGGVWGAVHLVDNRPDHDTGVAVATRSASAQRVPAVTSTAQMLETIRQLGLAAYPEGTVDRLDAATWTVTAAGTATPVSGADVLRATEWHGVLLRKQPTGTFGLDITAQLMPPDALAPDLLSCGNQRSGQICQAGVLPDGRAYRESEVTPGAGLEGALITDVSAERTLVVVDTDVVITVTQRHTYSNAADARAGWPVTSTQQLALASDPRLVPPRPDPMPALPSYLACRSLPRPSGCPGAPSASGHPAEQVVARMRELAAQTIGPDAVEVSSVYSWAYRNELPKAAWGQATGVSATFTSTAKRRYVQFVATILEPGVTGADPPCATQTQCFVAPRSDGVTEVYSLDVVLYLTPPHASTSDVVVEGQLMVSASEGHLGVPSTAPFDMSRITLTREDLSRLANDPGLRLATPTPLPTVPVGDRPCYPGTEGTKACAAIPRAQGG